MDRIYFSELVNFRDVYVSGPRITTGVDIGTMYYNMADTVIPNWFPNPEFLSVSPNWIPF